MEVTLESIKYLFDTHPAVDVFFFTSDGQAFANQDTAQGHAQRLADKTIEEVDRIDVDDSFDFSKDGKILPPVVEQTTIPVSDALAADLDYFVKTEGGDGSGGVGVDVLNPQTTQASVSNKTTAEIITPVVPTQNVEVVETVAPEVVTPEVVTEEVPATGAANTGGQA